MKPLLRLCLFLCLVYLQSCSDGRVKSKVTDTGKEVAGKRHVDIPVPHATGNLIIKNERDIIGYWTGFFYSQFEGKVTISIDEIDGAKVSGHTFIAGIYKPFVTEMDENGDAYHFYADRPGVEKYDGRLKIDIGKGDSVLRCFWTPYASTKPHESVHGFSKRLFHYDPKYSIEQGRYVDYKKEKSVIYHDSEQGDVDAAAYLMATPNVSKYNPSVNLLAKEEVANMKKTDILVLRNSIFARHGYAFKKEPLWNYFSQQDWYIPISADVTAELTPVEKKNIEMLMRYEKNAKDNYDTFGR